MGMRVCIAVVAEFFYLLADSFPGEEKGVLSQEVHGCVGARLRVVMVRYLLDVTVSVGRALHCGEVDLFRRPDVS